MRSESPRLRCYKTRAVPRNPPSAASARESGSGTVREFARQAAIDLRQLVQFGELPVLVVDAVA